MNIQNACLLALATSTLALVPSGLAKAASPAHAEYVAHLQPMNKAAAHASTAGEARFTVNGDKLTIDIRVHGAPPDTIHWQHFHGFKDGQAATCASMAQDANHDGIVDLIETGKTSGTTMVPFIADPASMDVAHGTYPTADAHGDYHYHETVSLKALDAAFAKQFPGQKLDLAKRVVYIHGVPDGTKLPSTVASLGPIPAQVILPIACGRIERVGGSTSG
ncbi:MAG TPA: hypothetical protein VFX04_02475 [Rhodanobacteraceae bacterium]|nr:hypothetical protein [Rhodanobacteraceae bacterium]